MLREQEDPKETKKENLNAVELKSGEDGAGIGQGAEIGIRSLTYGAGALPSADADAELNWRCHHRPATYLSFTDHRPSLPHHLNRQSGREGAFRTLRSSRLAAFGVVVDERGQAATDGWAPSWSPAHTGPVGRRSPQPVNHGSVGASDAAGPTPTRFPLTPGARWAVVAGYDGWWCSDASNSSFTRGLPLLDRSHLHRQRPVQSWSSSSCVSSSFFIRFPTLRPSVHVHPSPFHSPVKQTAQRKVVAPFLSCKSSVGLIR
jgi:hypothetical protein